MVFFNSTSYLLSVDNLLGNYWHLVRALYRSLTCTVRLVNHRLHNSPPGIYKPVVDLKYCQTRLLAEVFLLLLRGVGMLKMKSII